MSSLVFVCDAAELKRTQLQAKSTTGCLDLDIHTGRQAELVERFDRLGRSLDDIDQPLVRADLKLLP